MSYAPFILIVNILAVYILAQQTLNRLASLLYRVVRHQKIVYSLIALFFFPGTLIHEMAHFVMAVVLFLRVERISLLPVFHKDGIRLGSVTYIKRDFVRGVLVGVAPVFVGVALLWWLSMNLFPAQSTPVNIALGYLILVISSTMFSSKQDLVDVVYLIPVLVLLGIVAYLLRVQVTGIAVIFAKTRTFAAILRQLSTVNTMLFITIGLHAAANILMEILIRIGRKRY